jgi:vitamin B12 transporter
MKDQDFVNGGGKQIEMAAFTVVDLNLRYRVDKTQSVALSIENLGDIFYTEKFGFNMPGRNTRINYRYEF